MKLRSLLLAAGLASLSVLGLAGTAQAADKIPAGCTGARQLGSTAYVTNGAGANIASVKQYYGVCDGTPKNWSYVYVWQSFFDTGKSYHVKAGIITANSGGQALGFRSAARPTREIVSVPVATTGVCTRAWGGLDLSTGTRTAQTAWDC
ncbi:hypothetical protein SAMN05192558_101101 [Actinokineospora alba]|uniref:Peptidase inhibitor family I36 n=1 Tax=Actinokineospora alba TaxID=504798 RepID=A0A1H0EU01_9PSEU|nr:hypothetical protein [Actinokineospora alba]TDP69225.1 hypothetical protein C8E96_4799 [Actinokineospora alba]SDI21545.1 hypothetical protein SAMN05421871_103768 [Actinokineospora alba]SDN85850.1 hypothetical protein SAMN05192558_101101 [Actinokineospora alba]